MRSMPQLARGRALCRSKLRCDSEEMIESELFGHRRGAFAGAAEDKTGKLEKAHGGTLFLDEVGDMSLKTQAKVLRALEEQRFEPVGAAESVQVDARVVASTNKNLEEEIERGNFREDLFYRLNVIPFHVPPLRERIEDVPQLADHFLREFTTAYGRKPKELTEEALRVLGRVSLAGQCARVAESDGADRHHESAAARRCAPHSARSCAARGFLQTGGALRESSGSARGGRA